MAEQFYTILTSIGKNKLAQAAVDGRKIDLTDFALGDGLGAYYNPVDSQNNLKREVWRGNINIKKVDPSNPHWIIIETSVPADIGGFMVREAGVFDRDGDLIAIGKYPETYKPVLTDGTAKDLYIKFVLEISNVESVNLTIDPTVGLATRKDINILDGRVSTLESHKVKRYGVEFNGSNANGTRVEDAIGMVANVAVDDEIVVNDFDNVSFFNRPICCGYHDDKGKFHVNAYRGEPGFAWDGSNGEVYYEETPFGYKGDLLNYVSVTGTPLEGYELSPRFKNWHDKEYSPVFWTSIVDLKPTSRSGVFPHYGSVNDHMTENRKYHAKAHTETMAARMSDYILQLVEFATKDLQTVMMGAANMPYSGCEALEAGTGVNRIVITDTLANNFLVGQTISIGTSYSSDNIAKNRIITSIENEVAGKKAINFDGAAVNIEIGHFVSSRPWKNGATNIVVASSGSPGNNTDGKHPCIWRGKVDPWGTAFSAICDMLVEKEGIDPYTYTPHILEDPTKYANGAITADYKKLSYQMATADGYAKTLGTDERFPHAKLPNEVGASSMTYLSAYYWIVSSYDIRAVWVGGYLAYGRYCSPVCFTCHTAPSYSSWTRLSRLFVSRD